MGLSLAAVDARARRLLSIASDVVGLDVPRALERGSRALGRTEVLQPVIAAVSLGAAHAAEAALGAPSAVLGHSLGELSAVLYACGTDDEAAIRIAHARGEAMARAAEVAPGAMLATAGGEVVREQARRLGLDVAAENAPDELVLSGARDAVAALAKELGAAARPLRTLGPWHAPSMAAAGPALAEVLRGALGPARMPVWSAVDGAAHTDPDALAALLVRGLSAPVRWTTVLAARGGAPAVVLAPSKVVASLLGRNRLAAVRIDRPEDLRSGA